MGGCRWDTYVPGRQGTRALKQEYRRAKTIPKKKKKSSLKMGRRIDR